MKQFLSDVNHECLVCRVPNECKPGHALCGVSRGMKLEIYPADSHSKPRHGLPQGMWSGKCGFEEQPLFKMGDGMMEFIHAMQKIEPRKLIK